MGQWTPATEGADFEFTPILKPLEPFRDSLVVVSNLTRAEVNSNHAASSGCWLTGVPPKRTDGPDFEVGVSLDQVIAQRIGQDTTFPSLEVATEDFTGLLGRVRSGLQLRLHEHAELADADDAAADGDQPARRVRTPVRWRRDARATIGAHAYRSQPARFRG